jgi:hypothetical protein
VEAICGILFGGVFVLLGQLDDISFGVRIALTIFCSILGTCILAFGLIVYDKRK